MLKREVFPAYRVLCEELSNLYELMLRNTDNEKTVNELCKIRGYIAGSEQYNLLNSLGVAQCTLLEEEMQGYNFSEDLGLLSANGVYILNGRYTLPIRDIESNIVSLVGYFPDIKKYITLPTPFFSKEIMFFNLDDAWEKSMREYNGVVFLVEGIFDCLSIRSLGLPVLATMGSSVSEYKRELLKLFSKVIYIPDNDIVGRRALNRNSKSGWRVPTTATGVKLTGTVDFNTDDNMGEYKPELVKKVKDTDNLVTWFEADSIRELLLSYVTSKEDIEILTI